MPRTTPVQVSSVIETDGGIDLAPFISTANELVTECCGDVGYTETRLELIERWLTAHFYAIRDPRAQSEKAGSVAASYAMKVDMHLQATQYGQQALTLDTNGGLAALNQRALKGKLAQASVKWLGTPKKGFRGL